MDYVSIPLFPQLWDTDLIFTEYAQNPSHFPDVWPLSDAETIDLIPRRLSFDQRPVCPSIVANTNDSRPRRLSSDHYRK